MKRLAIIALLFVATGCTIFRTASGVADRAYIGMSVEEFKKDAGLSAELEAMTVDYTVYRMDQHASVPSAADPSKSEQIVIGAKFFHFDSQGRLFKIDSADFREERSGRPRGTYGRPR